MANPTTNFGWVMPTATDLVTDLPADFNVFGQGVDTSMQYLLGGTTGQVLSKTSGTNMAFTWVTPTDQTPLTTKGDLFTYTTTDARLGVGTNGQILSADSTAATGLAWVTPNPGDITAVNVTSPITGGGTSGDVTIAIQDALTTQKGAVQLSDSTSTTSSVLAATPTAVKSAYDLANAAIPKTLTTTTGDTIYASAANTPARLGIGTTGQVLKVVGGLPAWGAATSTKSYSLIGSANLISAGTITVSGISSMDNIMVMISGAVGPANAIMTMRFNSDATGPYRNTGMTLVIPAAYATTSFNSGFSASSNSIDIGNQANSTTGGADVNGSVQILGAASSGFKAWTVMGGGGGTTSGAYWMLKGGMWENTASMTSVSIICNAGANNFTAGTIRVYGAA